MFERSSEELRMQLSQALADRQSLAAEGKRFKVHPPHDGPLSLSFPCSLVKVSFITFPTVYFLIYGLYIALVRAPLTMGPAP